MSNYDGSELLEGLYELGIEKGDTLYVTGNLSLLGRFSAPNKKKTLERYFSILLEAVGPTGTIMMPTFTFYLCNTETPFSLVESPCETGVLPEFVRHLPRAVRSMHPFSSFVAYGANAEFLCTDNTSYVYGPFSPFDRLLQLNGKNISIGMKPERTCSIVHHVEQMMSVPYRYVKEFNHPIKEAGGNISMRNYYLYCLYRDLGVSRDRNQKIMKSFVSKYPMRQVSVGKGSIYAYSCRDFFDNTSFLMKNDPYIWLEETPIYKAYTF